MNTARDYVHKLIDQIPNSELPEIIDYITYIKTKSDKGVFADFSLASESSTSFWDNGIDDEVWDN